MTKSSSAIDPEALLSNTSWLRVLGRGLVADPNVVDDALQETLLAALERLPEEAGAEPGLRAWLARVLRNQIFSRARAAGRRRRREVLAARAEALPDASAPIEKLELERALIDAIDALEPDDREVVVLRYFEGLSPASIAERQRTTPAAVRSRLSRALEKLRARLDRRFGGDRRAWATALVELAVRRGAESAAATPTMAVGAIAAFVLLAGSGALLLWSRAGDGASSGVEATGPALASSEPTRAEPPAPAAAARVPVLTAAGERDAVQREVASTATPPVGTPAAKPTFRVTARFVDPSARPLAGVRLCATDLRGKPSAESDADGRAALVLEWHGGSAKSPIRLVASGEALTENTSHLQLFDEERGGKLENPGELSIGEIVLHPAGALVGRVVDDHGSPVAGATVYPVLAIGPAAGPLEEEERRVFGRFSWPFGSANAPPSRTDDDGRYRLAGVAAVDVSVAAKGERTFHGASAPIRVLAGGTQQVPDLVLASLVDENVIRGRVVDGLGQPVMGADVRLLERNERSNSNSHILARTDRDGRFQLLVLRGREYDLAYERDRGEKDPGDPGDRKGPFTGGAREIELRFVLARSVEIEVVDEQGEPVPNPHASLFSTERMGLRVHPEPSGPGRLRFTPPSRAFHVSVGAIGFEGGTDGPFAPETCSEVLRIALRKAITLEGRVTAAGAPIAHAMLHVHPVPKEGLRWSNDGFFTLVDPQVRSTAWTDEQGKFVLQPPAQGQFRVDVVHEDFARAVVGPLDHPAGAAQALEIELGPGGSLEGRLLVAAGVEPAGSIGATNGNSHVETARVAADGSYRFGHLAPGRWQVLRSDPRFESMHRMFPRAEPGGTPRWDVEVVAGETSRFDVDARDEVPCPVRGRLAFDGERAAGWTAVLSANSVVAATRILDADGRFELRSRKPGPHRLVLRPAVTRNLQIRVACDVDLAPAGADVALDLATGTLELENLATAPAARSLEERAPTCAVLWESGGTTWAAEILDSEAGRLVIAKVPAGRLRVRVRPPEQTNRTSAEEWPIALELDLEAGESKVARLP